MELPPENLSQAMRDDRDFWRSMLVVLVILTVLFGTVLLIVDCRRRRQGGVPAVGPQSAISEKH